MIVPISTIASSAMSAMSGQVQGLRFFASRSTVVLAVEPARRPWSTVVAAVVARRGHQHRRREGSPGADARRERPRRPPATSPAAQRRARRGRGARPTAGRSAGFLAMHA